ncbi:MAG: DUF2461 domain-containing protein [Pseudomonadota bacterium]
MHLPALLQFLAELHANNTKPWFLHNKPHYDILRAEFIDLVADVGKRIQKFDTNLGPFEPKKTLFRIYRDVRFSKDKTPFKTHIGAVIGARTTDKTKPVYYFHIDHKGTLLVACGLYGPDKDIHKKIRDALVAEPKKFTTMLRNKRFVETYGGLSDENRMSRPPKGYAPDLPMIEHIKHRHFICMAETSLTKKPPKDLTTWLADRCEAAYPLVKWLREASH